MNDAQPIESETTFGRAAYGGDGWQPRESSHAEEIGSLWGPCGIDSEWRRLETVLLCRPGRELTVDDHDASQFLAPLDLARAQEEHDRLAEAYRAQGVEVLEVPEVPAPPPNRMFCADQFVMTPEGAILGRAASRVRAGEEMAVAAALAQAQVPILRTMTGNAVFEGADLMWLDPSTVLIAHGLRTNLAAIEQVSATLDEIGVDCLPVDLPYGTMHLMGMLRIADSDLAIAWPRRTPHSAVLALRDRDVEVAFLPDLGEAETGRAMNFVTLGPRKILMPGDNPTARGFYEALGIEVIETPTAELAKAAGAVGCLTGIVSREKAGR